MPSLVMPLDAREMRVLEGLRLRPRKSFGGRVRGERLTKKRGISIEFADYREYAEGDDLRHLDWNVLARLEVPVTKTYRDEEDLAVHLLLDASPSMDYGEPTKLEMARKLACAVGYLGLSGGDAVYPRALGLREKPMPSLRSRSSFPRLTKWADATRAPEDPTSISLATALRQFAGASARPGLVVLISDGLDPEITTAIRIIAGRGHEIMFMQVLSELDLDPDLEGDLRLLDGEGGSPVELTANGDVLKKYRQNLKKHIEAVQEATTRAGGRVAMIQSDRNIEDVLKNVLKKEGWVG